jgi:hypothetical protein
MRPLGLVRRTLVMPAHKTHPVGPWPKAAMPKPEAKLAHVPCGSRIHKLRVSQKPVSQNGFRKSNFASHFANQGKPRIAHETRRSLHRGKVPNGVRWKNLSRRYRVCRLLEIRFSIHWSWRRDLNPRPPDYKSGALPTELRQQIRGKDALARKPIPLIPSRCTGQLFKVSQGELGAQENGAEVVEFESRDPTPIRRSDLRARTGIRAFLFLDFC